MKKHTIVISIISVLVLAIFIIGCGGEQAGEAFKFSRKAPKTIQPVDVKPLQKPVFQVTKPVNDTVPQVNVSAPKNESGSVNDTHTVNNTYPENYTMPVNDTYPGNYSAPTNDTVPTNSTYPGNYSVPVNESTLPVNETASGNTSNTTNSTGY